jgi:hypothetical protein
MRYHWGLGVGHIHVHRPTSASSCIPNQPMDVETSDNVPTDPEAVLPVPADGDPEVTTANNTCHEEFADPEMVLENRDPEGWDDVESDTSEGGGNDSDYDSEEDFGDIYE